jgi:uncharacterized protein YndB with AHSA1/START domain
MTAPFETRVPDGEPTGRVVEQAVAIAAPVEAVWKALTDAEELMRWFPLEARVTPGPGGKIWMSWREMYRAESRIDVWEPGRRLRIAFPVHPPLLLATDYHIVGKGGTTVLRVVTSGFGPDADWDETYGGVRSGWAFELRGLVHYLERHRGRERRVAYARAPYHVSRAEAWSRLVGPGGWFGSPGIEHPAAGARYSVTSAAGDPLRGTVELWDPPRQAVLAVDDWNDALIRLELEEHALPGTAMLWASTYDLAADQVEAIERRWRRSLPPLCSPPTVG